MSELSFGWSFYGLDGLSLELVLDLGQLGVLLVASGSLSLGGLGCGSLAGLEAVHASGSVHKLLLARVERMTIGANFNIDVLYRGVQRKLGVATITVNGRFECCGVDCLLHNCMSILDTVVSVKG